jgi:pyroglutamyl-peptidase
VKIKTTIILLLVLMILSSSSIISSQSVFDNNESTTVLVVGFGPFLNFSVNPSELIAAELDGEIINGAEVTGLQVLPNLSDFDESIDIVYQTIDDLNPDYVFSIGLAAKYDYIRLEKIGYNFKIEIRENPRLEILIKGGKLLRISPFPTFKIARELRKAGIPSQTGFYPGLSLCNGMLYAVLHYTDINDLNMKSGFIHVPLHKSEENPDGMELGTMVNATRIIISECIDHFS